MGFNNSYNPVSAYASSSGYGGGYGSYGYGTPSGGNTYGNNLQTAVNQAYSNQLSYNLDPATSGLSQGQASIALQEAGLAPAQAGVSVVGANNQIAGLDINGLLGDNPNAVVSNGINTVNRFDQNGGGDIMSIASQLDPGGIADQLNQRYQQTLQQTALQARQQQISANTKAAQASFAQQQQNTQIQQYYARMQQTKMMMAVVMMMIMQKLQGQNGTSGSGTAIV